jgi:hypothetical protein
MLSAGSSASSTRGGYFIMYGNEHASSGDVLLGTGNTATSEFKVLGAGGIIGITFDGTSLGTTFAGQLQHPQL